MAAHDTVLPAPVRTGEQMESRLLALPQEVLLRIMVFLDVPDLVALSRTCHLLHYLPSDPLLHRQRLASVPPRLSRSLQCRPPLAALRPPNANIYLTTTLAAARKISRKMVTVRLRQKLGRRPPVTDLVNRGVLPGECFALLTSNRPIATRGSYDSSRKGTDAASLATFVSGTTRGASLEDDGHRRRSSSTFADGGVYGESGRPAKYVSPRIIGVKRAIEREAVKNKIRGWVDGRGKQEMERRRRETEREMEREASRGGVPGAVSVKGLVRRFRAQGSKRDGTADGGTVTNSRPGGEDRGERWGRGAVKWVEKRRKEPTRAHVSGMRRFWEGIGRAEA